jgi:hypothetical protein
MVHGGVSWERNGVALRAGGNEIFICLRHGATGADDESSLGERVSAGEAIEFIRRALRENATVLRVVAQRLDIVDRSSLPQWSDERLRVRISTLIERGNLVAVRRSVGSGVGDSGLGGPGDLVAALRRLTGERLVFEGRSYELVGGAMMTGGRVRDGAQVVPREEAMAIISRMVGAPAVSAPVKEVLKKAREKLAADWRPPMTAKGLVLLRDAPRPAPPPQLSAPPSSPPVQQPPADKHWVEFRFQDEGKRPIAGVRYAIGLPDRSQLDGKLDGQGKARYDGQPSGSGTIELAEVDDAHWGAAESDAHEPVELRVVASGVDPGEPVSFEIFRLYRERAGESVAKVDGKLDGSRRASARWTPDVVEAPDDQYVFKATVGGAWRKSEPIAVRKRATSADWSSAEATEGDTVTLQVAVRGVRDGESATLTLFEKLWRASQDTKLTTLQAQVTGGAIAASWTIPAATAPLARGDTGRRDFYYTVEVGPLHCASSHLVAFPQEGAA